MIPIKRCANCNRFTFRPYDKLCYKCEHILGLEEKECLFCDRIIPAKLVDISKLYNKNINIDDTGLRPNELESAKIENKFVIAINSKRKNGKIEFKKIPICNKLKPYIDNNIPTNRDLKTIRKEFNSILPEHRLYDLRTTFYTRCQELSVEPIARNLFVGHSLGTLGNTYTDISDEYLLKEGEKLNQW